MMFHGTIEDSLRIHMFLGYFFDVETMEEPNCGEDDELRCWV
jgi:hypothetical protein